MNKVRFGDILYIKGRIGWQALSKDEYLKTGDYYLVTGVDITDTHRINFSNCYYVSKERYDMDEKIQLKVGDIIVTKDGTIGKIGIIDELDKPATLNSHLFLIRNEAPDILDTNFLFQILRSNQFQKFAQNNTHGSNIPAFTQSNISEFEIDLPTLDVQMGIANVLKNIDDKIINNIDINFELESMAKTIYDYWFLQFEFPNTEGKPYKSSGGKMVYNEQLKKEIPEGWEVKTNSLSLNEFNGSNLFDTNLFSLKKYDILFGSIRPYLKKACVAPCDGAVAGTVHCYTVNKENDYNFSLITLRSDNLFKFAINNSKGTKMPVVSSDDLLEYVVAYNEEVVKLFNSLNLKETISENIMQNQGLTSLRDFLLPLLMNGQVTFKEKDEKIKNNNTVSFERFNQWKQSQGYAARGDVDDETLKIIFDAMEEDVTK